MGGRTECLTGEGGTIGVIGEEEVVETAIAVVGHGTAAGQERRHARRVTKWTKPGNRCDVITTVKGCCGVAR